MVSELWFLSLFAFVSCLNSHSLSSLLTPFFYLEFCHFHVQDGLHMREGHDSLIYTVRPIS